MEEENKSQIPVAGPNKTIVALKFILLSLFGICMFFIPFDIKIAAIGYVKNGGPINTIAVDHIVGFIRLIPEFDIIWGSIIVIVGLVLPFINKKWNSSVTTMVFTGFKVLALFPLVLVILNKFGIANNFIVLPAGADLAFIWSKVVVPVTTLVPVGAVFLAFITKYGLMEFIGVFMKPIMRPIWRTPGKSAVDAVASFVGSYSVGLLITDQMYQTKKYSDRESVIIASGFSTVSATFMVIVAKTAGIMDKYLIYFWVTLVVTFLVTSITAYIWPICKKKSTGYQAEEVEQEAKIKFVDLPKESWKRATEAAAKSGNVFLDMWDTLKKGVQLSLNIGPTLLSIGYLGLILAALGVFNIVGYIFVPFTWVGSLIFPALGDPVLIAGALASSLAEMFLPISIIGGVAGVTPFAKAVVAIVCVSEILFFSASIPCILSTKIPMKITDILIIWFERVVLSFVLALPFALLLI